MLRFAKDLVFGRGARPHTIRFGIGAGCRFVLDPAHKSQLIVGLYEAEIGPLLRRIIMDSRTLIDIGASDGYYPIVALRLNRDLTAIGCEAQEAYEEQARANYNLNFPEGGPPMEWIPKLVGKGEGYVSLDQLAEGRSGPFLVKIDVEGAEVEVLKSGPCLLSRNDCRVLLEVHSGELEKATIELLQSLQYTCQIIKNAWWRTIIPEVRPLELNRWVFAEKVHATSTAVDGKVPATVS